MKKSVLTLAIILLCPGAGFAAVLHDSTWEAPFTPTYTVEFGSPEAVAATGPFGSNSLAFNTLGNSPSLYYDQISYQTGATGPSPVIYDVSFDIFTDSLIGSNNQFAISFDTPTVRNLYFTNDGNIEILPGWDTQQVLASYNENESMHIDMKFDIGNNIWDVSLNNAIIYSGIIDNTANPSLQPAEFLSSIRFSQGLESTLDTPSHNATVYLDNVLISAVPIPASLLLFVSGLFGLALQSPSFKILRKNSPA